MKAKLTIDQLTYDNIMADLYNDVEDRYEIDYRETDEEGNPTLIYLWDPHCGSSATVTISGKVIGIQTAWSGYHYRVSPLEEGGYELLYVGAYNGCGEQQLLPPTIECIIKTEWENVRVLSSLSADWVDMETYKSLRSKLVESIENVETPVETLPTVIRRAPLKKK